MTSPLNLPASTDSLAIQAGLVAALRQAAAGDAANPRVALVETHISFVLLTGRYAYKIKKAVALSFLDFRTLAARRFFCREELRLNRRFAPELYLDVVSITGTVEAPRFGGQGPAIEYAVRMREFPADSLASEALARGQLAASDIDTLAAKIAAAHQAAAVAAKGGAMGAPDRVLAIATGNFREIRPLLDAGAEHDELADLDLLERWTLREHARLEAAMARRRDCGRVRECHGDLHLGNIALLGGVPTLFDCIEFNEEMRWIDVMSEIAFTVMDLRDRGRADFAHRLQSSYLEVTGDYDGLHVLRFYLVYRAMVRAKIARMRATQLRGATAASTALADFRSYLRLARHYSEPRRPWLVVAHGLSGSGKSTLAQALLERTGAVRIRTDVERARRPGGTSLTYSSSAIDAGPYAPEATRATYRRVLELVRTACENGYPVIADATFLKRWQRDEFRNLAAELGVRFVIVSCVASEATMRERIIRRMAQGGDASQADLAVFEHQLLTREPLGADELDGVLTCDSDAIGGGQAARDGAVDRIAARMSESNWD